MSATPQQDPAPACTTDARLFLLVGPPAVGKLTLARELARQSGSTHPAAPSARSSRIRRS